jgi:hypothetical protein
VEHEDSGDVMMVPRAVVGFLTLSTTVMVANASPPELDPIKRALLAPQIAVNLCAPKSFSIMELGEVGLGSSGRLTSQKGREILLAEAGFRLGLLSKQEGLNRVYAPTTKLTSLPKYADRADCYVVDKPIERRNVEFVQSHKLQLGTTEARLVLFKFEATYPPLVLEYLKSLHPIKKNGLIKGRCVATYDPFKKEWNSNINFSCDYADIDSEFVNTGLEQGHGLNR